MRALRTAAVLIGLHGLIEIGSLAGVIALLNASGPPRFSPFAFDFLAENLALMGVMGVIFGVLRVVGAVGLWRNRLWGYQLALMMCVVTLVLMIFMLPSGVMDGVLAGSALVVLLIGRYGKAPAHGD